MKAANCSCYFQNKVSFSLFGFVFELHYIKLAQG